MKRVIVIIVLLLCGTSLLQGQVADSVYWRGQGVHTFRTGKGMMLAGAVTAAVGGGIMWYALSPRLNPPRQEGEFHENMGAMVVFILGASCAMTGAAFIIAGIPVTVAGHSMMQCDMPWRNARYASRGLGLILEGGYSAPDLLQARAALGYHFNSHLFLGAGIAPGYWMDTSSYEANFPRLSLPLYADFRWSIRDRMISPYLGFSAGVEMADFSPYLGAEIGGRIRTARTSTHSFWSAVSAEVAGGYGRIGLKMGYSF